MLHPEFLPVNLNEELRRQVSCLLSLKEESRALTQDELEDLWFTMHFAEKLNDHRAIGSCLEVLQSHMDSAMRMGVLIKGMVFDEALMMRVANN